MTVYFARSGDFIKIGYTSAPTARKRMRELQTGNPDLVRLLSEIPGAGPEMERNLQDGLEDHHHRGEWYRAEGPVLCLALLYADDPAIRASLAKEAEPYMDDLMAQMSDLYPKEEG